MGKTASFGKVVGASVTDLAPLNSTHSPFN
jgi:hypothetical protein